MLDAHAVVIGISNYSKMRKLKKACNDAQSIRQLLADPQACGYPADKLALLEDAKATRDAIYTALDTIAQNAKPTSIGFIFFAGHGARVKTGDRRGEYLCPVEADLSSPEDVFRTCIPGSEITNRLRKIQAGKLVVALDCCHSGGLAEARGDDVAVDEGLSEDFQQALVRSGNGRVVFAAARPDEQSFERPNDHNGLFTKHMLAGLRGAAGRPGDQFVRIFDLFSYVQPRVTAEEPRQHPVFKAEVEENFPLALCAGGRGVEVGAAAAEPPPPPPENYSREALLAILYRLLSAQFDEVIFRLDMPQQDEPSIFLPQSQRAMAVIKWVSQPERGGLPTLVAKLRDMKIKL